MPGCWAGSRHHPAEPRATGSGRRAFLPFLCLAVLTTALAAQDVEVPVDADGKLAFVSADLERRLTLFPEINGFLEARLFETPGGTFVLEISYRRDGRLHRLRRPMSDAQVAAFRARLSDALRTRAPQALLDQEGRGNLMRGALALSLGFYGWAAPVALDVDDDQTAVALYMLVSAGGFFVPFLATRNASVTEGQASLALYGATRGVAHGILGAAWANQSSDRAIAGWGLLGGLAESVTGFVLAGRLGMTQGTADLTGTGGDFGGGIGLGLAYVAGLMGSTLSGDRTTGWGVGIATSFLGMGAGYRLAMSEPYTPGDNGVFRAAGLMGSYAGLATARAIHGDQSEAGKGEAAAAVAGAVAGIVLGQRLVHRRDFTNAQGTFVSLGTLGGGLIGAGVGYLISDQNDVAILVPSAVGAALGFGLLYASFAETARIAVERAQLRVRVDPLALVRSRGERPVPVVTVSTRF